MKNATNFQFCFDILFDARIESYVPIAYILNNCDKITYVNKKATPEIIKSYGIDYENLDVNIKTILEICNVLKPENLLKKFDKTLKSKKTVLDLLADSKTKTVVKNYIDLKINQFFTIANENNFPISLQLSKDKDFYNSRISTNNTILDVKLFFDKNENGMDYSLQLTDNESIFYPIDKKITILLNQPSWIVFDKKLYQIANVNSNKLKPFFDKKTIEIPQKTVSIYFEKFIKDIVKKVDIEANGFKIIQKNKVLSCKISAIHDFFKNSYSLELVFDYSGFSFSNTSKKATHSFLENDENSEIQVIKFKRNLVEELLFEEKLIALGFQKNDNNLFQLIGNNQEFDVIHFVIDNFDTFIKEAFVIDDFSISNYKLQTNMATISVSSQENNDWFDVKMIVKCGEFEFSFSEIIQNIKDKNKFFKLPNDTFFLIPDEWFAKYAPISNLSKIKNGNLILPKSNYTILENLNVLDNKSFTDNEIVYQQSDLLKANLRPYQIEGVKWLLKNHNLQLGACLADDMGLGKTLQTLATLVAVQDNLETEINDYQVDLFSSVHPKKALLKALIVAPSSLVFNWYNESKKFTPHFQRLQYVGNDRKLLAKKLDKYDLVFTSYAVVSRDIEIFKNHNFNYLIIDESQQIKNRDSKVFKSINEIVAQHKISLSGTPIENSLSDLWSQMQFINPDILGDFKFFTNYFKIPIEKQQDETKILELKNLVNPFILRRTKEQVLHDLPELTEQIVFCEMESEQEKWYEEEKSKARNELLKIDVSANRISVLKVLMKLRQLSNHPKMVDKNSIFESGKFLAVTNYIESVVQSGQKILIFSSFVQHLALYEKWCLENKIAVCKLIGETSIKERENLVKQFQDNNAIKIFFISLKAGCTGLNLTAASHVIMLDPWWNPFIEKQAIGRAHRIGQENKVTAVRFISKNSIEEKIILLQDKKKLLSDSILELGSIPNDLNENLLFLLE